MLSPTSIGKTSVQLANACFHKSIINGLKYYADHSYPEFADTAMFLQVICDWFNIIDVKSLFHGHKSMDSRRNAITRTDREQLNFLLEFYCGWKNGRGCSSQTFHAAKVTTSNFRICTFRFYSV